jgi:hypothetical protein
MRKWVPLDLQNTKETMFMHQKHHINERFVAGIMFTLTVTASFIVEA